MFIANTIYAKFDENLLTTFKAIVNKKVSYCKQIVQQWHSCQGISSSNG